MTVVILIILLLALGFIPLKTKIYIYREPNRFRVDLTIWIWRIPLRLKEDNALTRFFWNLSRNRFWKRKPPPDLRAGEISWKRLVSRIFILRKTTFPILKDSVRAMKKIVQPVKIRQLWLLTEIGLEDAAQTGIAVGLVWSLIGLFYNLLGSVFNMQYTHNRFTVQPNFQGQNLFAIELQCIFEMRFGHIIIIIFQVFRQFHKVRGLLRRLRE